MRRRLLILTEIISPYRIPVFNALARRDDVELHVVFLAETDPTLRQWPVYRSEIRFSHEVLPSWRRRIRGRYLLLSRGVCRALMRWRPEAIICGGYNYLASWQANLWAGRHRVPFVLWCESTSRDRRRGTPVEFLKRLFLGGCDGFVVPGTASRAYLKALGVSDHRIVTAPNAVDTDFFGRAAETARRNEAALRKDLGLPSRYFLYVGRLVEEKGVFDLLDAYAMLEPALRSEAGLVFAGNGPAMPTLMRRSQAIAPGTVRCPGFLHRDALSPYYALAETLVFPTRSDTWGLVVNEAMACGLPVIATDVAGCTADLVTHGRNGLVVSAGDPRGMAQAMGLIAADDGFSRAMGARSAEIIRGYTPEACAAGLAAAGSRSFLAPAGG